jgi:hypothetical protein
MAKYSKKANKTVESAMRRKKKGTLTSGRSGRKVKSRKQAIAIGLSEAREKGQKVPSKKAAKKKAGRKKSASKKSSPRKSATKKKSSGRKSTGRKTARRKSAKKKSSR